MVDTAPLESANNVGSSPTLSKDERGTTPETLAWCAAKAGVEKYGLDVAASQELHVCQDYMTKETDGLRQRWAGDVWCNPPFSNIRPWVEKAWSEFGAGNVRSISMLIPGNRTEQPFWQELIEPNRDRPNNPLKTYYLLKRTKFKGFKGSPNFPCVLLVWRRNV